MKKKMVLALLVLLSAVTVVSAETIWIANHDGDTLSIIDPDTDTVVATYQGSCMYVEPNCITEPTDIAFSPDGSIAYVIANSRGVVAMLDTAEAIAESAPEEVYVDEFDVYGDAQAIAVSPDGERVYVAETDQDVVDVYDAEGTWLAAVQSGDGEIALDGPVALAITPDSEMVVVANKLRDSVTVIDATSSPDPEAIDTISVGDAPEAVVVGDIYGVGMRAYTANANSDNVSVVEVDATPSVVTTVSVGDKPRGLAFYPNMGSLLVANADGFSISKINVANNTASNFATSLSAKPFRLVVTSGGSKVYVSNPGPDKVSVFDAANGDFLHQVSVGYTPGSVADLAD